MRGEFAGRHVVVTGGTGALGQGVIETLVEAGARVHVPVRDAESLGRFQMARDGRVSVAPGVDLTDDDGVREFYAGLPELWASVHCAGGFAMAPIAEAGSAELHGMMSGNVRTCFLCCREAVRRMRAGGGGGRIVNVASRQALEPRSGAGMVAYTASKAAVAAITQALAEEVAAEGIWVNAVVPSILDTPANREALPDADHDRWPAVEQVAETIAFLASPRNAATRGALVPVYGRT